MVATERRASGVALFLLLWGARAGRTTAQNINVHRIKVTRNDAQSITVTNNGVSEPLLKDDTEFWSRFVDDVISSSFTSPKPTPAKPTSRPTPKPTSRPTPVGCCVEYPPGCFDGTLDCSAGDTVCTDGSCCEICPTCLPEFPTECTDGTLSPDECKLNDVVCVDSLDICGIICETIAPTPEPTPAPTPISCWVEYPPGCFDGTLDCTIGGSTVCTEEECGLLCPTCLPEFPTECTDCLLYTSPSPRD